MKSIIVAELAEVKSLTKIIPTSCFLVVSFNSFLLSLLCFLVLSRVCEQVREGHCLPHCPATP